MIGEIKRKLRIRALKKRGLKKGVYIKDKDLMEKLSASQEISMAFNKLSFNHQNKFKEYLSTIKSIEEDIDFIEEIKLFSDNYENMLRVDNKVSKKNLEDKINTLRKEVRENTKNTDLFSRVISFGHLMDLEYDNKNDRPRTNSFIDLLNNKAINRRADNCLTDLSGEVSVTEGFFPGGAHALTDIISGKPVNAKLKKLEDNECVEFNIELSASQKANRLCFDFIHVSLGNCEIELMSSTDSKLMVFNGGITKEHHDCIFPLTDIKTIRIKITNQEDDDFDFGINNFYLYRDEYEEESVICTKPIHVGSKLFMVELDKIEFNNTKCYTMIGLIKDGKITWKDNETDYIYNFSGGDEEVDSVVVMVKLKGTRDITPIVNAITLRRDVNDFVLNILDYSDFDNNRGRIVINMIGSNVEERDPLLNGKGRITINLNKEGS